MLKMTSPANRLLILSICLVTLLFLAYVLTLAGVVRANDEVWIIDATQSVARRGTFQLSESIYELNSLLTTQVEPVQPVLSAPLYWLAWRIPWIGNVHGLALFTPLITALTALLLFHHALALGYRERTALAAALLFGLTTMAWPYAQTFFREPLTAFSLLAAAFCWERWRRAFIGESHRVWAWLALALAASVVALLSKESALIILPACVLLAYPGRDALRRYGKQLTLAALIIGGVAAITAIGLLAFRQGGVLFSRYQVAQQVTLLVIGLPQSVDGLLGYFVSPGKAIWWFSPVTLLALASPLLLPRRRWRESWLLLGTVLWFGLVYAAIKRDIWFGGAGWGARFMLPIIPFLMLAALPALDRMLHSPRRWPKIALAGIALVGLMVQLVGVSVDIYAYYNAYQRTVHEVPWVGPAIWSIRWSQIVGSLLLFPQAKTDILWLASGADWLTIAVISAALVVSAAVVLSLHLRADYSPRRALIDGMISPLLALAVTMLALGRAFLDPRYQADNPTLWEMDRFLESNLSRDDVILLSTSHYVPFFMNYYKGSSIWYGLPDSPGERYSPEQPPKVVSENVDGLVAPLAVTIFTQVAQGGEHYAAKPLWLVVDSGPFLPWATRPPEWYLASHSYEVGVTEFSPRARVVEYLPVFAPGAAAAPAQRVGAKYGPAIRLVGYDSWASTGRPGSVRAGDLLGISLVWEASAPPDADYTVAVHWLDAGGQVAAQQDRKPVGGFAPTSRWRAGERIRDNYGFVTPQLPPGQYTISVVIYSWPSLDRLPVTDASGKLLGDSVKLFTLEVK